MKGKEAGTQRTSSWLRPSRNRSMFSCVCRRSSTTARSTPSHSAAGSACVYRYSAFCRSGPTGAVGAGRAAAKARRAGMS